MKMIISPAKTLNFISSLPVKENSQPIFQKEVAQIHKVLKELSPKELSEKMNISMSLAQLNWERNEDFSLPHTAENARQAIFAYAGTVYENLDAYSLKKEEIEQLQSSLRILSGLYGLLKPLDLIAPYRLEMNVKLLVGKSRNLYDFWKKKITLALKEELHEGELFVNLASTEYFRAIDTQKLKATIITPVFKNWKDGTLKTIVSYSKKARGQMVRYIAQNKITSVEELKGFHTDGYCFDPKYSKDNELVFIK
ncbi:peroxide stress protein YaaA [Capnocytophaga sp. G2]|uniref:peroxide stress protein YaaA n=1 Tax=Capnocytophaga sp. G2 TaxID=3110695 RepID=UPI002B4A4BAF|nr:peroxide stress protein YaaA [Capnocytophaga sp. G2]MEB3004625.1 peroxide stress protein YaaA [Capnocytophaga sp. G2]